MTTSRVSIAIKCIIFCSIAFISQSSWAASAEAKGLAVLAVTGNPAEGWTSAAHYRYIAKPWVDQGGQVDVCMEKEIPAKLATGKYNILVYSPMWDITSDLGLRQFKNEFPPIKKAIDAFMAKGGGVLVLGSSDQYILLATHALTEPWGARMMVETIKDPATETTYPDEPGWAWAYTTQISGPAATGVKGIWYPAGGPKWTWPLEIWDANWQVVARGEKTSTSMFSSWSPDTDKVRRTHPFDGGVPIAAIRTFPSNARAAIVGVPCTYSFLSPHIFVGAEAFLFDGLNGKPSDGRQMLFNLLCWLGEPSQKAGLGGGTTPPQALKPYQRSHREPEPAVNWNVECPTEGKKFRGLAGARTVLSSGKSTVAEYAKAAKAAGVDFIIFLEDHKLMTPEKNQKLRDECLAASDETFQAIPGYTIEDEFGNHWFMAGQKATYPRKDYLSEDGKTLAGVYKQGKARSSPLGHQMVSMIVTQFQMQVLIGSWDHKVGAMPPWDYRDHSSIAVVTTDEGGKVIDDVFDVYPLVQQKGNSLEPFAFELMNSAGQVAERAKTGYLTYIWKNNIEEAALACGRVGGANNQYISNGPEIINWNLANQFYPGLIFDDFRPDLYHMKLCFDVRSAAGLKEIKVYSGNHVLRSYNAGGAAEFKKEVDLYNIPQQSLILRVTDMKGRRAITKELYTKYSDFSESMCGDRNNQIAVGFNIHEDGSVARQAPSTGLGLTPDKGPLKWQFSPCFPFAFDDYSPNYPWDGGRYTDGTSIHAIPMISVDGKPELRLHNSSLRGLFSPDVMIGLAVIDGGYPEKFSPYVSSVWDTVLPVLPTRYLEGSLQMTYWRTKPDNCTATFMDEALRFKNDTVLDGSTPIVIGTIPLPNGTYVIRDSSGKTASGPVNEIKSSVDFTLDDTGYISQYNKTSNTVFYPMTKGAKIRLSRGTATLYLDPADKHLKAGTQFSIRLLGVGSSPAVDPCMAGKVDAVMGISTGKPEYSVKLENGKIASQKFTLAIESRNGYASGTISRTPLPAYLPITVAGLHQNWTAVYMDRVNSRWRPIGLLEGTAYVQLDPTKAEQSFFVGHPAVCDNKEISLQLTQTGGETWKLEAHNPTSSALKTTISFNNEFAPLQHKPIAAEIKAGQSAEFELTMR